MSDAVLDQKPLIVGGVRHRGLGWWGVICLIVTEGSLFGCLLFSYYYCAAQLPPNWIPDPHPSMRLALPDTAVLLTSSLTMIWGDRGMRKGSRPQLLAGLAMTIVLGIIFLVVQYFEWSQKTYSPTSGLYGSLYFIITGFHMAHVVVGVVLISILAAWAMLGYFDRQRNTPVLIISIYWHFVDIVWLFIFTTFYITPYLGWL